MEVLSLISASLLCKSSQTPTQLLQLAATRPKPETSQPRPAKQRRRVALPGPCPAIDEPSETQPASGNHNLVLVDGRCIEAATGTVAATVPGLGYGFEKSGNGHLGRGGRHAWHALPTDLLHDLLFLPDFTSNPDQKIFGSLRQAPSLSNTN